MNKSTPLNLGYVGDLDPGKDLTVLLLLPAAYRKQATKVPYCSSHSLATVSTGPKTCSFIWILNVQNRECTKIGT